MKTAFVAGSAGFIGSHLVRKLQEKGYYVIGMDIQEEKYCKSDRFYQEDLRLESSVMDYMCPSTMKVDDVYCLAAIMGGLGFIGDDKYAYDIMVGSTKIIINCIQLARHFGAKLFFSSSACVYNQYAQTDEDADPLQERDAYPAYPDLTYGWQKLFSEQLVQATKDKIDIRIARFHNIFGIEGTWDGGKEKYPAAICRKVAQAEEGNTIIIWGDGLQTRSYLNVDECLNCVFKLMDSDVNIPLNIGSDEMISCNDLAKMVIEISGKDLKIEHDLTKPQGVRGRNSDNTLIKEKLGYAPQQDLKAEMTKLYNWINKQIADGI